jgi:hypothetical protein
MENKRDMCLNIIEIIQNMQHQFETALTQVQVLLGQLLYPSQLSLIE